MLSHWCATSLSLQFCQLQLFASHCINKTKGKPFPFKCSIQTVEWMTTESEFALRHAEIFQAGSDTSLLSGGYQRFFPELFHGQDKNLTTDINLKLKVNKQTCAFYILMAWPCRSPGATLPFHCFLSGYLSVYTFLSSVSLMLGAVQKMQDEFTVIYQSLMMFLQKFNDMTDPGDPDAEFNRLRESVTDKKETKTKTKKVS